MEAMMQKNDIKSESMEEPELIISNTPTSSTDYIHLALSRHGSLFMQLVSVLPDHNIENHRTVISREFIEPFIDMICELTEYYPEKPKKRSIKRRRKPKKQST